MKVLLLLSGPVRPYQCRVHIFLPFAEMSRTSVSAQRTVNRHANPPPSAFQSSSLSPVPRQGRDNLFPVQTSSYSIAQIRIREKDRHCCCPLDLQSLAGCVSNSTGSCCFFIGLEPFPPRRKTVHSDVIRSKVRFAVLKNIWIVY